MKIISVSREKKHLVRLSLDDGSSFCVDLDTANDYALTEGSQLDGEKVEEIKHSSDYTRAKSRALWYLDRSEHTEKALFDKLLRAGFDPKASAEVIARFKELGLVNDKAYALRFAERCAEANISRREAYMKLLQKGVPKELANEALNAVPQDEQAQIRAIIDKKYKNRLSDKEDVRKVYAALIRKGFSFGAVKDVLKKYSEELIYANGEDI